jgi:Gas vesicle synthesis protein GvpL/GvpF
VIELYAITDHPGPALPEATPLQLVARGSLAGVCGAADGDAAVTPEGLWRHERIVEELMRDRDVLPVRYGTRFPDEVAAGRVLEERREQLGAALERVRGAVELAVRVIAQPHASGPRNEDAPGAGDANDAGEANDAGNADDAGVGAGTAYLRARQRESAAASEAAGVVHEPLSAMARDHLVGSASLPGELLRVAYLVSADAVPTFTETVARLQQEHPALLITCTGPWPAYSFAQR